MSRSHLGIARALSVPRVLRVHRLLVAFISLNVALAHYAFADSDLGPSDPAAVQAMRTVIAQSGGVSTWSSIRSAEEVYTVARSGEQSTRTQMLLDDWSSDAVRYRRGTKGQSTTAVDHNGSQTFTAKVGNAQYTVPEFDQARTLLDHLPGAAAEIMLRRPEYVLRISANGTCASGSTCVDVLRTATGHIAHLEQQWVISTSTGLPTIVRFTLIPLPGSVQPQWEELQYLGYGLVDGLEVPTTIRHLRSPTLAETWTLISIKKNSGFIAGAFDQELAQ